MTEELKLSAGVAKYVLGDAPGDYKAWKADAGGPLIVGVRGVCSDLIVRYGYDTLGFTTIGKPLPYAVAQNIHYTFAIANKLSYVQAGFNPPGAEFLTGMAVELTHRGAIPYEYKGFTSPNPRLFIAETGLYELGRVAVLDIAFAMVASYHSEATSVTDVTVGAFSLMLRTLGYGELLWKSGVSPKQIVHYVFRQFQMESLLCVVVEALIGGQLTTMPVMLVEAREFSPKEPLPMAHPGGITAAKTWWNFLSHVLYQLVVKERGDVPSMVDSIGDEFLDPAMVSWYTGDFHPALDVSRLILLALQDSIKPVAYPKIMSEYIGVVAREHDRLAVMSYAQHVITQHDKFHTPSLYDMMPSGMKLQDGAIVAYKKPVADCGSLDRVMPKSAILEVESAHMPLMIDEAGTPPSELEVREKNAFERAKTAIKNEKYTDEKLLKILREGKDSKHHSKFWRGELWAAQSVYDEGLSL